MLSKGYERQGFWAASGALFVLVLSRNQHHKQESEDMAITRGPKRKRMEAREWCNSCTSNTKKHSGSSGSKQQAVVGVLKRILPGPPYDYSKCMIRDRPLLREQHCKEMIRTMGLERFIFHAEIPKLNRKLCDDFIASYDAERGCGLVQESISIVVDAETVAKVTGLPLGQKAWDTEVRACSEDVESLKKLMPSLKSRPRGCYLRDIGYGSRSKHFVAIAEMLVEKMVCKTRFVQYANPGLIVGMDKALRGNMEMQWAEFVAEMIRSAVKATQSSKARFAHGEWLSGIIQHALASKVMPGDGAAEEGFSFGLREQTQVALTNGSAKDFGDCSDLNSSKIQVMKELAAFKAELENMMREPQEELVELKKELENKEGECEALKVSQSQLSAALEEAQKARSASEAELEQLRRNQAEQLARVKEEHSLEVAKLKQEVVEQETDLLNFMNDPLKAFGAYTLLKKNHRKLKEEIMS